MRFAFLPLFLLMSCCEHSMRTVHFHEDITQTDPPVKRTHIVESRKWWTHLE